MRWLFFTVTIFLGRLPPLPLPPSLPPLHPPSHHNISPPFQFQFEFLSNLITFHIKWDSTTAIVLLLVQCQWIRSCATVKQLNFMHAHNLSSWLAKIYICLLCFAVVCRRTTNTSMYAMHIVHIPHVCTLHYLSAPLMPHNNPNVKSNHKTKTIHFNSNISCTCVLQFHLDAAPLCDFFCLHRVRWSFEKIFSRSSH